MNSYLYLDDESSKLSRGKREIFTAATLVTLGIGVLAGMISGEAVGAINEFAEVDVKDRQCAFQITYSKDPNAEDTGFSFSLPPKVVSYWIKETGEPDINTERLNGNYYVNGPTIAAATDTAYETIDGLSKLTSVNFHMPNVCVEALLIKCGKSVWWDDGNQGGQTLILYSDMQRSAPTTQHLLDDTYCVSFGDSGEFKQMNVDANIFKCRDHACVSSSITMLKE